jgi:sigma-B regulation protein RsbU (phosphoserine phosphatase)
MDATGAGLPKSALYVPLTMGGSMRGEIVLVDMEKEQAFTQSDVRLLETLANSMSVALENARLWEQEKIYLMALEHEFEIGREIQAGFLPHTLPQPKGWEIAASLQPAREVAGDFYDVFELPEGKIGLVIADVCDKGLGAALFMTLFRSFIRGVSNIDFYARSRSGYGNSSAQRIKNAISLTNNYIVETHGDTGMFATIFFGIFDPRTGGLTYINGGHLPPLLINQHGVKDTLTLTGPAVGGESDVDFAIREVMIEPGDTLFAYTDGLTDAENTAGETFSEQGLIPLFVGEQALSSLLTLVQKQIDTFSAGTPQMDDITMLAVKRRKK